MKLGRVLGVELHLNLFFLALLALYFIVGLLGKGLIAFGVVFLHELAHVVIARRFGYQSSIVELLPFGGVARMGSEFILNPGREAVIALAGPSSNLLLAGLALAFKNYGLWDENLGSFFLRCNIILFLFNLIPALPLDGGRVFRALLARKKGFKKATYQAASLGQVFAVAMIILGTIGLYLKITGVDVLVGGLFLFYAASREKKMAPYLFIQHLTQKKDELMAGNVLLVKTLLALETTPLREVLQFFVPQKFHLVFIVDQQGEHKGVIGEIQIINGLLAYGTEIPVGMLSHLIK